MELVAIKTSIKKFKQIAHYGLSAVIINLSAYLSYIIATSFGVEPKLFILIMAPFFIILTFVIQKKYIFKSKENVNKVFFSYLLLCILGNALNIFFLYIFVDIYELPHQIVQFCLMIFIGLLFYLCAKYFVY